VISTSDFRKGGKIEYKDAPHEIIDFQHHKMGRGGAIVRTKLKNLKTGSIFDDSFKGGEKFEVPDLEEKSMQYLYKEDDLFYFMDNENYEQFPLNSDQLGEAKKFLKDNMEVKILSYKGSPLAVEVPMFVQLAIVKTDPGFKGDTASTDITELQIEREGAKLKIKREKFLSSFESIPSVTPSSTTQADEAAKASAEEHHATITSPIVGIFHRAPSPEAPPFVDVGSYVRKGQVLCIVEAMKLMNEIESDTDGTVSKILIENGQPVEYGEPLFLIEPSV
jgi:elongation factor P